MKKISRKKPANQITALNAKLLDKINDSVFLVSLHGDIVYVNKTAYQSLGYTRDELMKTPLRILDVAGKADKIKTRIKGFIKKGNDVFETAHLRKNKSVMPVELN